MIVTLFIKNLGVIICNLEGGVLFSSFSNQEDTVNYAKFALKTSEAALSEINDINKTNDELSLMSFKTSNLEINIAKENEYFLITVQKVKKSH